MEQNGKFLTVMGKVYKANISSNYLTFLYAMIEEENVENEFWVDGQILKDNNILT